MVPELRGARHAPFEVGLDDAPRQPKQNGCFFGCEARRWGQQGEPDAGGATEPTRCQSSSAGERVHRMFGHLGLRSAGQPGSVSEGRPEERDVDAGSRPTPPLTQVVLMRDAVVQRLTDDPGVVLREFLREEAAARKRPY